VPWAYASWRDLRIARYSRYRERQPYFRHARAFALDHQQPQQTKMRLQLPSPATLRIPQRNVAEI
jgi:hypothetical protein